MKSLKFIDPDEPLLDVDYDAWKQVLETRGGCSCHISPPCFNCVEPIGETELNEVGYTYEIEKTKGGV